MIDAPITPQLLRDRAATLRQIDAGSAYEAMPLAEIATGGGHMLVLSWVTYPDGSSCLVIEHGQVQHSKRVFWRTTRVWPRFLPELAEGVARALEMATGAGGAARERG